MDQIVIAHISDVHIGDDLFKSHFGIIHGWRAHDKLLCEALKIALKDVHKQADLEDDESIDVVLTGDLSQHGSRQNFDTAHTYFHKWTPARSRTPGPLGLGLRLPRLSMIPGNHDHWQRPGSLLHRPSAHNPNIFPKSGKKTPSKQSPFKQTPWHERLASTNGGITFDLFGVDSNSGLAGAQTNLRARGSISADEFKELESLLKAKAGSGSNNVRVILCHHALSKPWASLPWVLSLKSVQELTRIVHRHRISAVLTGHTHVFFDTVATSATTSGPSGVVELRSASTLQGRQKPTSRQGFWAHRIRFDQPNSLEWTSWKYQWNGTRFKRLVQESGPWVSFRI